MGRELGGEWNHVLQTHLSEMLGGVIVLPLPLGFSAWVCVLRVGDSRVTLFLPNSGRERFRARRACFEIVGASDFRRGEGVLLPMVGAHGV